MNDIMKKENEFSEELWASFGNETGKQAEDITFRLPGFDKRPVTEKEKEKELIECIYREILNLKGASRTVNKLIDIQEICQSMEHVLASLKTEHISLSSSLVKLFFDTVGVINRFRLLLQSTCEELTFPKLYITSFLKKLESAYKGDIVESLNDTQLGGSKVTANQEEENFISQNVRSSAFNLNSFLHQSEDMVMTISSAKQLTDTLKTINDEFISFENYFIKLYSKLLAYQNTSNRNQSLLNEFSSKDGDENILGKSESETIINDIEESLIRANKVIKLTGNKITALIKKSVNDHHELQSKANNLLDEVKKASVIPFSSLPDQLINIISSLNREHGKEIESIICEEKFEVDKKYW